MEGEVEDGGGGGKLGGPDCERDLPVLEGVEVIFSAAMACYEESSLKEMIEK
jgi:hypothetical protein